MTKQNQFYLCNMKKMYGVIHEVWIHCTDKTLFTVRRNGEMKCNIIDILNVMIHLPSLVCQIGKIDNPVVTSPVITLVKYNKKIAFV